MYSIESDDVWFTIWVEDKPDVVKLLFQFITLATEILQGLQEIVDEIVR